MHEWEIGGGPNIPRWMEERVEASDHLIGAFSPEYVEAMYSQAEWFAAFWNDPEGRDGFLMPVVIAPFDLPVFVRPLTRLDLTNCSRDEARDRLIEYIEPLQKPDDELEFE